MSYPFAFFFFFFFVLFFFFFVLFCATIHKLATIFVAKHFNIEFKINKKTDTLSKCLSMHLNWKALIAQAYLSQYLETLLSTVSFTSCFGTLEQVRATDETLNTLNFNEKKNVSIFSEHHILTMKNSQQITTFLLIYFPLSLQLCIKY